MNSTSTLPSYLLRWDHSRGPQSVGGAVQASHRLSETSLFDDNALAALIDRYPRSEIEITTTGTDPSHPSELRLGEIGPHDGRLLLSMLRQGHLCLTLKNIHRHDQILQSIIRRLNREWAECLNTSPTECEGGDLVMESPGTQTYLECDSRHHLRWQIRGSRQTRTYSAAVTRASWPVIQSHLIGNADHRTSLYFEPAMDDHANVVHLPSESVALLSPLVPHRSTINESLSVSLITRHLDTPSRKTLETLVGNAALRRFVDAQLCFHNDHGIKTTGLIPAISRYVARMFFGNVCRRDNVNRATDSLAASFRLDPNAIDCVAELDAVTKPKRIVSEPTSRPVIAPVFTNSVFAFPLVASES